jgi:hypothetical protein
MESIISHLAALEELRATGGHTPFRTPSISGRATGGLRGVDMSRFSFAQQSQIAAALEKSQAAYSNLPSVAEAFENEAMVGQRLTQVAAELEPIAAESAVATEVVALEGVAAVEAAEGAAAAGAAALGPVALAAAIVAGIILVGGLVYWAVTSHDDPVEASAEKIDVASPVVEVDPNFGPTAGHPDLYTRRGGFDVHPAFSQLLLPSFKCF